MSELKYRHPQEPSLAWSGKGKQPKWVEAYLANGGSMVSLDVSVQYRDEMNAMDDMLDAAESDASVIDLGIGEPAPVSLGTKLYAQRIAAGIADMPADADTELRRAVDTETANMNSRLAALSESSRPMPVVEQPEVSQQQLEVCLKEFGFQAMTAREFIQAGIEELNQATIRACRSGVAFWAAQEALKSENESSAPGCTQDFIDWITDAGLTKERVYECIRIAKFYSRLPPENRAKALSIGKKHALLLAALPQEVIDQAAESGNDLIGRADMMTVAELKDEIKALQRREKNYEAELERAGNQIKRLSEAKKRTTDFLLRTEELREECMALQLGAELHLNSLRKLFEETDLYAPEGTLQAEHVWIVANTLAARALDLVDYLRARCPDGMPDRPMSMHLLTPDEAARWLLDYPLIENRFAAEQAVRESRREAARPRGPGRPKGSANKGGEA